MDPYLEERAIWPDVHATLITYIREVLQPQLRPKYIARIGERVQLAVVNSSYVPDVLLVHTMREPAPTLAAAEPLIADEPQLVAPLDDTVREPYIEIIARETGDVVTLIELLSPANKVGDGRDQYIQKQTDLLATGINLVEIDLLGYPLSQPLPKCRIPLLREDPDAVLDLQAVFTRSYDIGSYDLLIDYTQPPPVPLSDAEAAWLDALLQEKGLR